jgi:hypothetical protein
MMLTNFFISWRRLVVQSIPPFAVVHTNAAYCRLTGLDSHKVVGKPVRTLLSLPDGTEVQASQDEVSETADATSEQVVTSTAGSRPMSSKPSRQVSSVERLVVSSGLGHLHSIIVHTRPHHMLGKNISFFQDVVPLGAPASEIGRSGNQILGAGSSGTGLTGSHEGQPIIHCTASIAPVVSTSTGLDTMIVSDREGHSTHPKAKRRKVYSNDQDAHRKSPASKDPVHAHRMRHAPHQTITHYVIQLQHQELPAGKPESEASLSSNSTSVEARLLGLSKSELLGHRKAVQSGKCAQDESEVMADNDAADSQSQSTGTEEPISAVG